MGRRNRVLADLAGVGPAFLLGVGLTVAALLVVIGQTHPYEVTVCLTKEGYPPPQAPSQPDWWRWAILAANVGGFALGHLSGQLRARVEAHRPLPESARAGSRVVQVTIIVFLLGAAVLTAYETVSVVPDHSVPSAWPLSYYVRCVNDVAPIPTLLGGALVAFLLGHWLSQPAQRPRGEGV